MQILAMPRVEVSATLKRQGGTMAPYAAVVDRASGDTLGEALWTAQRQRQSLLRTKQRSLWAGLGAMGLLTADFALNPGSVGTVHLLGRLGGLMAGVALMGYGGMTGDRVDAAAREMRGLSYVARELRALGGGDAAAGARVAGGLSAGAPTRAEMLELARATEESLAARPGAPRAVLEQVRSDRAVLQALPEGEAGALREQVAAESERWGKLTMAGLFGGGASALATMFVLGPLGLAPLGIVAMGLSLGAGVMAQDRRDGVGLRQDVVDRWELQVADLKGLGQLASGGPRGGATAVGEHFVQLGSVRVPVKVRR